MLRRYLEYLHCFYDRLLWRGSPGHTGMYSTSVRTSPHAEKPYSDLPPHNVPVQPALATSSSPVVTRSRGGGRCAEPSRNEHSLAPRPGRNRLVTSKAVMHHETALQPSFLHAATPSFMSPTSVPSSIGYPPPYVSHQPLLSVL